MLTSVKLHSFSTLSVLTFYFSSVSVQPTLLPVKVSTRNDEQVNSCKNGPNLKEDWQSEQKMGHNNVDDDDDDNGNEDDDDDQGTVEGGSRLSVDKGERAPSLLHLRSFSSNYRQHHSWLFLPFFQDNTQ